MFHGIIPGREKTNCGLCCAFSSGFVQLLCCFSFEMTMAALMATPDGHFTLSHGLVSTIYFDFVLASESGNMHTLTL